MTAENEISLVDLWRVLVQGRKIIFFSIVLMMLAALGYALLAMPVYRAELLMVPADASNNDGGGLSMLSSQLGGLAGLVRVDLGDRGTDSQTALAVLVGLE